jgi:hypothetical protein
MSPADRVVIGMDPHKRSVTIDVMAGDETVLGGGRFGTDRDGYRSMLDGGRFGTERDGYKSMLDGVRRWPARVWAVEGCARPSASLTGGCHDRRCCHRRCHFHDHRSCRSQTA